MRNDDNEGSYEILNKEMKRGNKSELMTIR